MASTINSLSTGSGGITSAGDASGVLALQTNSTTAITIDTAQKVGIGMSTPYVPLQVTGTIKVATGNAQGILSLGDGNGATTNCGIWRGAANAPTTDGNYLNLGGYDGVVFATGAASIGSQTERMRIDSSGNVGIGITAPNQKLEVSGSAQSSIIYQRISNTYGSLTSTGAGTGLQFYGWDAGVTANIKSIRTGSSYSPSALTFETFGGAGTSNTNTLNERMRIDDYGRLAVGGTAGATYFNNAKVTSYQDFAGKNDSGTIFGGENAAGSPFGALALGVSYAAASPKDIILVLQSNASRYIYVQNMSAGVYLSQGATAWSSNSDERLKDIIEPITNAAEKVATLRTVIGKYKTDDEGTRRAFLIAQDVQAVLPEAVTKAEVKGDDTEYMGVNYTDMIPLLTAAIKELKSIVDAQAVEIAALKAKVGS